MNHPSNSSEQQAAEHVVRARLAEQLGVRWRESSPIELRKLALDGYAHDAPDGRPVLLEIFVHVGRRKAGQTRKLTHDMAKLLLAERLTGKSCRKVVAIVSVGGESHPMRGWQDHFRREFGIEVVTVELDVDVASRILAAQERQRR